MNDASELWRLPAVELARRYRDGTLSPPDALDACLARLDAVNPRLNAVIAQRDRSLLRAEAQGSAQRHERGQPLSALDGVPLTGKDNLLTADLPTTWGSLGGREHRSTQDELAVARARSAGALLIGKTNVPEFTLEGYTANRVFGVTRNPWDTALTPGGSSGGAVAAVAAGVAPLALGTDGGGSIRRPASHCGVVGLKPSIGALPREHTLPSLLLDFEVVGPMARTVADVALLYRVLHGPSPADRAAGALRVLYVPTLDGAPVDPEIVERCAHAAHRFSALGHTVREGTMPLDLGFMSTAWPQVGQIGLARRRVAEVPRDGRGGCDDSGDPTVGHLRNRAEAAARCSEHVPRHRRARHTRRGGAALAGGRGVPDAHRRPQRRAARPRRLHRLGQRGRPAGARASGAAVEPRAADRLAAHRCAWRRGLAARARRRLRNHGTLECPLALSLTKEPA